MKNNLKTNFSFDYFESTPGHAAFVDDVLKDLKEEETKQNRQYRKLRICSTKVTFLTNTLPKKTTFTSSLSRN
jgi:hypothetical protein